MISTLFNALIYQPLYNGLIFLMDLLGTFGLVDAGIAVILFTIIIKLILFPLSRQAVSTQLKMRSIEPTMKEIKERYRDDKQKQAEETLKVYRENNINPFSSFLLIFIQLPIVIALYWVFLQSGLPEVNIDLLYSFVAVPEQITMQFLGVLDISQKSWFLAGLASLTSFLQMKYSLPPTPEKKENPSFSDDLARSMNLQMKYVLPVVIFFIAYTVSGAVALYWTTSNIFTIGQELVIRKQLKEPFERRQEQDKDSKEV